MKKTSEMVREFHDTYGVPVISRPQFPSDDRRSMRRRILQEEYDEYLDAEMTDDLVEVADALADLVYIAFGTALEYGIDLDRVLGEVHRSNMSKLDAAGKPIIRDDGKVLKGPNYEKPDIARVLGMARI